MAIYPTPFTVTRHVFTPSTTGGYDGVGTWKTTGVSVKVHGWGPPTSAGTSPFEQQRSPVIRDLDLYAPPGTPGKPEDRWVVDGDTYKQVGHVEDFTHGPFGFQAGVRINLLRVEG